MYRVIHSVRQKNVDFELHFKRKCVSVRKNDPVFFNSCVKRAHDEVHIFFFFPANPRGLFHSLKQGNSNMSSMWHFRCLQNVF